MRVFVTGATGLVGSHTVERLKARGHDVVALVRPTSDASFLAPLGVDLATGDIADSPESLAAVMAGCDAVVHAAAIVLRRAGRAEYRRVNVRGTERVLRAAAMAAASRVVHVSSVAVYGHSDGPVNEDSWLEHEITGTDVYGRSKREAERIAWRLHEEGAVRLTTVRPGAVYGERDRLLTPWLARLARLPVLPLPAGGHHTVPVVYAGNVADGIVAALERDGTVGRAYNLSAEAPLCVRSLIETFGGALGHVPRLVGAPPGLVLTLARWGDAVLGALPGIPELRLHRTAALLLHDNPYDSARARTELDWAARIRPAEALSRTAAWWNARTERAA